MLQYQNIKYSAYNEDIMPVSLIALFLVSLVLESISVTNSSFTESLCGYAGLNGLKCGAQGKRL